MSWYSGCCSPSDLYSSAYSCPAPPFTSCTRTAAQRVEWVHCRKCTRHRMTTLRGKRKLGVCLSQATALCASSCVHWSCAEQAMCCGLLPAACAGFGVCLGAWARVRTASLPVNLDTCRGGILLWRALMSEMW
jgi:hypothetical protein